MKRRNLEENILTFLSQFCCLLYQVSIYIAGTLSSVQKDRLQRLKVTTDTASSINKYLLDRLTLASDKIDFPVKKKEKSKK